MPLRRKPVTAMEADSYKWWSDFIEARMIAIQSMLALGRSDKEIARSIGIDDEEHAAILIETARDRQTTK